MLVTPACLTNPMAPELETPSALHSVASPIVTVGTSAVVTSVSDASGALGGAIATGAIIEGTCTYDESVPDSHHKAGVGRYTFDAAPSGLSFSASSLVFASDPGALDMTIKILDDKKTSTVHDSFAARSTSNLDVVPGVGVATIVLTFEDDTAAALSGDALADVPRDPGVWPSVTLVITGVDGWRVQASLVGYTPTAGGVAAGRSGGVRKRLPDRPK